MQNTNFNKTLLTTLFVTSLIISNVVTVKVVNIGLSINGAPVLLPGAMLCYALTFLVTDIIGEVWGKRSANECVCMGFICQICALFLTQLTGFLPAYDTSVQNAYHTILGPGYLYVLGSLIAYWCSQSWDVFIFHKLRNFFINRFGSTNYKWVWNNISTITSQFLDTIIFITISFGIGMGWLFHVSTLMQLGLMIIAQYVFKVCVAILDTPIFYLLTKEQSK